MTRDETKKCIEVMQAYVDGGEVEYRVNGRTESEWAMSCTPFGDPQAYEYRIKPKPREFVINIDADGKVVGELGAYRSPGEQITVREVL